MSALVSIIIPVYNLEDYIGNCLEKLLCQTYKNLEILCIDDGSTDSSAQKIKIFEEKDPRVIYIHQENAGVSAARNKGLETATGEYIMFVDGDDYLHYQAVEVLLKCIVKSSSDMVSAHQKSTFTLNETMLKISDYSCFSASHEELFKTVNGNVIGKSSCAKLFKREFALKARFPIGISNGEDANYIVHLLEQGMNTSIVDLTLYYYYSRENSCVTSSFNKKKFSITLSFDDLCELLKNSDKSYLKAYCLQYLFQTIFYNRTMAIGTDAEEYVLKESRRIGKKWINSFKKCKDIDIKIRIVFVMFFYSRRFYELARMIQDPTMKDFYKNRKADRKD